MTLKPCPNCKGTNLKDCYAYVKCLDCGLQGPRFCTEGREWTADHVDRKMGIEGWNGLPRRRK